MSTVFRTEYCIVEWSPETGGYGHKGTATDWKKFGIHDTVNAPDPVEDWLPFFGVGSSRNRAAMLPGKLNLKGSIPDIRARKVDNLVPLLGLAWGNVTGVGTITDGSSAIGNDERIPSFAMKISMRDTSGTYSLVRKYVGGKINRMTLAATEGEELKVNVEEMIFQDMMHNRVGVPQGYSADVTAPTSTGALLAGGRYLFAGASIMMGPVELMRVKSLSISIDNQIIPKFYLSNLNGQGYSQIASELVEGKRQYTCNVTLDVADTTHDIALFDYLMNNIAGGSTPMLLTATFYSTDGGSITIHVGSSSGQPNPGLIATSGNISVPAPPNGYFPGTWDLNADSIQIMIT